MDKRIQSKINKMFSLPANGGKQRDKMPGLVYEFSDLFQNQKNLLLVEKLLWCIVVNLELGRLESHDL